MKVVSKISETMQCFLQREFLCSANTRQLMWRQETHATVPTVDKVILVHPFELERISLFSLSLHILTIKKRLIENFYVL